MGVPPASLALASPLGCVPAKCSENVRKMFGKCSELVGAPGPWVVAPLPPPPPPHANLRKCSEMLGNVRKMFGKCSELVWLAWGGEVGGAAALVPNIFRTFSEHFRIFPNISEHLRGRGGGWGGGYRSGVRCTPTTSPPPPPPIPQISPTFSTHFRVDHPPGWRIGERPRQFRTFQNISEHFRTLANLFREHFLPHPVPRGWKMLGKCSENVWKCLELVGAPVLWVEAHPPHPPPPPLRKSSEMFGNVRKMFGKCSENVRNWCGWPGVGRLVERPHQFRTFSEQVPNIFPSVRHR